MVEKIARSTYTDKHVNTTVHCCTRVMLPKHTAGAQTVLGSGVLLYVYTIDQCLYVFAVNLF
jgi:hypothetical protein